MYYLSWGLLFILGGVSAYVLFSRVFLTLWKLARESRQLK